MSGINVLAVLVAVLASAALGALWYSPALFLKPWVRAAGREPRQSPAVYAATFLSALVAAFAFAWWLGPEPPLEAAIVRGLIAGACFVAASLGLNYAFADRGLTLWLIDSGFHIVRFLIFGVVLGLWH